MIKREKRKIETSVVSDIICNKCAKSMLIGMDDFYEGTCLESDFGYGSNKDTLREEFHLCDDCYDEIVSSFRIKPYRLGGLELFFEKV